MSFVGETVPLILGTGGQSGSKNQSAVRPDQLIIADNVTLEGLTVRKEGGKDKYNSAAVSGTPSIIGGWDWRYDGTTQRSVIVTDTGDVLMDNDGDADYTANTVKSGLSIITSTVPIFVEGGNEVAANDRKLFLLTGRNVVQVLIGSATSMTDITNPPADWSGTVQPTFGVIHANRFFAGGNSNDPHRVYYSLSTDHEDFTSSGAGSISVFPGKGDRLVWGASFKGLLVLAKAPRGLYFVDTRDADPANWAVGEVSESIGSPGPGCMCVVDNDILFMDSTANIHTMESIQEFGNLGTRSLSDTAFYGPYLRSVLNLGLLNKTKAVFYTAKREAHFSTAGLGSSVNNRRVVVDFNRVDIARFRTSNRDTAESIWLAYDSDDIQRIQIGDDAGFVWTLDQETRSADGVGYNGEFQTPHLDFAFIDPKLGSVNKNWSWLELEVEPKGNSTLSIDVYLDDAYSETIQFNMGATGATLGSFVLGTDSLAGGTVLNKRQPLKGRSRRISLKGSNSGAGEDFSIVKFYFGFTLSDTEQLG